MQPHHTASWIGGEYGGSAGQPPRLVSFDKNARSSGAASAAADIGSPIAVKFQRSASRPTTVCTKHSV